MLSGAYRDEYLSCRPGRVSLVVLKSGLGNSPPEGGESRSSFILVTPKIHDKKQSVSLRRAEAPRGVSAVPWPVGPSSGQWHGGQASPRSLLKKCTAPPNPPRTPGTSPNRSWLFPGQGPSVQSPQNVPKSGWACVTLTDESLPTSSQGECVTTAPLSTYLGVFRVL